MHCDDKRTIFALTQYITDSTLELQELTNQLKTEDSNKKFLIQEKINDLDKIIKDSKNQLLTMK